MIILIFDKKSKDEVIDHIRSIDLERKWKVRIDEYAPEDENLAEKLDEICGD